MLPMGDGSENLNLVTNVNVVTQLCVSNVDPKTGVGLSVWANSAVALKSLQGLKSVRRSIGVHRGNLHDG